WCVSQIAAEPTDFDTGATAWTQPTPNWGTCTVPFDPDNFILTVDTTKGTGLDMTLPLRGTVSGVTVDWGDGNQTGPLNLQGLQTHTYSAHGIYTITISGGTLTQFGNGTNSYANADKIISVESFGDIGVTSFQGAFRDASNLTSVPTS